MMPNMYLLLKFATCMVNGIDAFLPDALKVCVGTSGCLGTPIG